MTRVQNRRVIGPNITGCPTRRQRRYKKRRRLEAYSEDGEWFYLDHVCFLVGTCPRIYESLPVGLNLLLILLPVAVGVQ